MYYEIYRYTECTLCYLQLTNGHFFLFTLASHKPTYQKLLPYMEYVDDWKVLGTQLLPGKYIPHLLKEIERTHKSNVSDCRGALLSEYIKVGEVSWDKVIDSLEKSHYHNVAEMIKQDIIDS